MAKKNKVDKEEIIGMRHIFHTLAELSESSDMDKMVKCFDELVINNKKFEWIKDTVNFDDEFFVEANKLVNQAIKNLGDE